MTTAYSGDGITFPDNSVQATAPRVGMVNRIINGDMRIDQRNGGASGTTSVYTVDRWAYYGAQASKVTWQQNAGSITPPAGFTNYLGCTSLSSYSVLANDLFEFYHFVEGYNLADLNWGSANAKTVTLSFWVRSSLTGSFGGSLTNNGNTRNYPFTYTISTANTWEQKSVTIAGDTSGTWLTTNGRGVGVLFNLGAGSDYSTTANAWNGTTANLMPTGAVSVVGTSGATWYVTGVQLEKGSATDFEYVDYGRQLQMCQRYYNIWSGATAPSIGLATCMATGGTAPGSRRVSWSNPVEFRAQPTLSTGGTIQLYTFGLTNLVFTGFNSNFSRKNIISFDANSNASGTGGQCLWLIIDSTSSANYIAASAEL